MEMQRSLHESKTCTSRSLFEGKFQSLTEEENNTAPANRTTMRQAFQEARKAGDEAAEELLNLHVPEGAHLANHNFGSSQTHRWFRGEDLDDSKKKSFTGFTEISHFTQVT